MFLCFCPVLSGFLKESATQVAGFTAEKFLYEEVRDYKASLCLDVVGVCHHCWYVHVHHPTQLMNNLVSEIF